MSSLKNDKEEFEGFISDFKQTLHHLFHEKENINKLSLERGLPQEVWHGIMSKKPLSVAIPSEYGGRGAIVKECLSILSAASYESLSLSLTFGINIALFLEPVAKYGNDEIKQEIFSRFLEEENMGGLMITEPDYGSDALNMKTYNEEIDGGYRVKGTKHWQGLTGMADYWLIASRKKLNDSDLARDIDFFIADGRIEKQKIVVEELYNNPGLYIIPYGLNKIDIEVPEKFKLNPESTGIKMMLDILHRSRFQFPGMGMGFITRMLDEATKHCENRIVGAGNLLCMDQVQYQLSRIQTAYTICSAMCFKSSSVSGIDHNLAAEGLEANTMKAVVTDLMHESAQTYTQLSGANGYRMEHVGGRGIMDSRPFQIFEGSNEMLYSQIAEMVTRQMRKQKQANLMEYLLTYVPTKESVFHFKKHVDFSINGAIPQRKLVDLGRAIARIICIGYVLEMEAAGFRKDLVENCIKSIQQEVAALISAFHHSSDTQVIIDYKDDSNWYAFI